MGVFPANSVKYAKGEAARLNELFYGIVAKRGSVRVTMAGYRAEQLVFEMINRVQGPFFGCIENFLELEPLVNFIH